MAWKKQLLLLLSEVYHVAVNPGGEAVGLIKTNYKTQQALKMDYSTDHV